MAETRIIPIELRRIILWQLCQGHQREQIEKVMAAALTPREVMPLDIADLRKTQRRVSALLGIPTEVTTPKSHRSEPDVNCTACSRLNPYRFLQDGLHEKGRLNPYRFSHDGIHEEGGLQDGTYTHFKGKNGRKRRTGIRYNHPEWSTVTEEDLEDELKLPPLSNKSTKTKGQKKKRAGTTSLPAIKPGTNHLVGNDNTMEAGDIVDRELHLLDELNKRMGSLASEISGASLRIDEDYVPMSVTVRKVADMDLEKTGSSPYQEFTDMFSPPLAGSRHISRENSLQSAYSSVAEKSSEFKQRSLSWCQCPEGQSSILLSTGGARCPECGLTDEDDHKIWCQSKGSLCLHCRRLVKAPRNNSWFLNREITDELIVTSQAFGRTSREASFNRGSGRYSRNECHRGRNSIIGLGTEKSGADLGGPHHVRFADDVERAATNDVNCPPKTTDSDLDDLSIAGQGRRKKRARPRHNFHTKVDPNVHRNAYILALKDAHLVPNDKTVKGKKKKGKKLQDQSTGVIFSYFPLLKNPPPPPLRPSGTPRKEVEDIGLRQDVGRKVTLKNAMKHIFGKIKLGDYYPGGAKYRVLE